MTLGFLAEVILKSPWLNEMIALVKRNLIFHRAQSTEKIPPKIDFLNLQKISMTIKCMLDDCCAWQT